MPWIQTCVKAGLGVTEIALVRSYIEDDDGRFKETKAYEKLINFFCDTGEMPYGVAKARTGEPDMWILKKLSISCKPDVAVV